MYYFIFINLSYFKIFLIFFYLKILIKFFKENLKNNRGFIFITISFILSIVLSIIFHTFIVNIILNKISIKSLFFYNAKKKDSNEDPEVGVNERTENSIFVNDYDSMKFNSISSQDKRSFLRILSNYILLRFDIIYTFFYPTILIPFHIKISLFFFDLNLSFCLNAILFSDEYITQRNLETRTTLLTVKLFIF